MLIYYLLRCFFVTLVIMKLEVQLLPVYRPINYWLCDDLLQIQFSKFVSLILTLASGGGGMPPSVSALSASTNVHYSIYSVRAAVVHAWYIDQ